MREVPGYLDYYASQDGFIYSTKYGDFRKMKPRMGTNGYWYVFPRVSGAYKTRSVHFLVALAFLPPIDGMDEINHINGIKTDNRLARKFNVNASLISEIKLYKTWKHV